MAIAKGEEAHWRYTSGSRVRDKRSCVRNEEGEEMQEQLWTLPVKGLQSSR